MNISYSLCFVLLAIALTQFIVMGYIIKNRQALSYDMGPAVGERFDMERFKGAEGLNTRSLENDDQKIYNLMFVTIGCKSCEEALKEFKEEKEKHLHDLILIIEGTKEEAIEWYTFNKYRYKGFYINKDELFYELKINRFPYLFQIKGGYVLNKGPLVHKVKKELIVYDRKVSNV